MQLTSDLIALLEAAGITEKEFLDLADEVASKSPSAQAAAAALRKKLNADLAGALDPAEIAVLVKAGLDELVSGHPSYNPHHFGGG